jgi:16S rRNA (guanine(966)-N(2))-methyltransferase RsmD
MRVIAGTFRRRSLRAIPGNDLRPTADRLRETLFNVLTAGNPGALEGTVWIDLYAGTGSVGIEAVSRGCGMAYFVDCAQQAVDLIRGNLSSLKVESGFEIAKLDAVRGLQFLERRGVVADFIFLDPPYGMAQEYDNALKVLSQSPLLNSESKVIAEHSKRVDPGECFGALRRYRALKQGDACLSFYRKGNAETRLP